MRQRYENAHYLLESRFGCRDAMTRQYWEMRESLFFLQQEKIDLRSS